MDKKTLLLIIYIPLGCCLVLWGLMGDPFGRTVNGERTIEETKVVETAKNTVSYSVANDGIYVATVHISNRKWESMSDKEKEEVARKVAESVMEPNCKLVVGMTSGKKLLFTCECGKDDYSLKL